MKLKQRVERYYMKTRLLELLRVPKLKQRVERYTAPMYGLLDNPARKLKQRVEREKEVHRSIGEL